MESRVSEASGAWRSMKLGTHVTTILMCVGNWVWINRSLRAVVEVEKNVDSRIWYGRNEVKHLALS